MEKAKTLEVKQTLDFVLCLEFQKASRASQLNPSNAQVFNFTV